MILLSIALYTLCACNYCFGRPQEKSHVNNIPQKYRNSRDEQPSTNRYAYFDTELLQAVSRLEEGNIALSPISIRVILSMLMEGSTGSTSTEIREAMRLPEDPVKAREVIRSWIQPFQENTELTKLSLATQLFLLNDHKANAEFLKVITEKFLGGVQALTSDSAEKSSMEINEWAKKETHGLIPVLVTPDQLTSESHALLASAVYFKGLWKHPFVSWQNRCFFKTVGECLPSVFMQNTDIYKYAYIDTLDAQAVEIPYKDERFSMLVVLPRGNVNQLGRDFLHQHLHRDVLSKLEPREIQLQLPRFSLDFKQDLVSALRHLQITDAFSANANFSRILASSNDTISVSNVFHSVKIVVNEEGSEAAAATGALFVPLMGHQILTLTADRPFFFFIRDSISKITLFAGRITNPDQADLSALNKDGTNTDDQLSPKLSTTTDNIQQLIYGALTKTPQTQRPYVQQKPGHPDKVSSQSVVPEMMEALPVPQAANGEKQPDLTTPSTIRKTNPPPLNRRPEKSKPASSATSESNVAKTSPQEVYFSRSQGLVAQEAEQNEALLTMEQNSKKRSSIIQNVQDPTKKRRSSFSQRISFLP